MIVFRRSALASAVSLALLNSGALAQEEAAPKKRATQLEEVVVTAQKREESLQDTPISLAAFSGDQLEQQGIADLGDITALVPNVDITPFPNSRSSLVIFMRGVGNNDSQTTQDPAVGIYLDGVYVGRSVGLTSDIADLERIEVLRGPQGTLYGRNTTGGAINLITAKPSGEFGAKLRLGAGNEGQQTILAQVDSPSIAGFSAKASYMTSEQDGWVENINAGPDFAEEEKEAQRLALRWDATDTLTLDYAYDYSEIVGPQPFYQVLSINENTLVSPQQLAAAIADPTSSQALIDKLTADAAVTALYIPGFTERASEDRVDEGEWFTPVRDSVTEIEGHSLTATWDSPLGTLKYIGAYRELEEEVFMDYGAGLDWFDVHVNIEQDQSSHELQLVGDLSDNMRYVAGLYFFEEESFEHEVDNAGGALAEDRTIVSDNEARAVYGQFSWAPSFLSQLELTLGARYTEDDRSATKRSINFENSPNNTLSGSESWSNFNPSLTANYEFNDDFSAYAKVVTGYKSGGFNVRSTEAGFKPPFNEEEMVSYETGFKSVWWNQRLRFNAAAFHSEYTDMQIQQIVDNAKIFLTDVFNAGKAEIDGFELDLTAILSEGLTVTLSYGYTDADFIEMIDSNPNSDTFGQDISESYTMPYAPQHTYNVGFDYVFPVQSYGLWRATVNYNWRDERYGTASNPDMEGFFLDDYGLWDARLSLSEVALLGADLTFALWGKNLADEEYLVHDISMGYFKSGYFGEPRTFGLDVTLSF